MAASRIACRVATLVLLLAGAGLLVGVGPVRAEFVGVWQVKLITTMIGDKPFDGGPPPAQQLFEIKESDGKVTMTIPELTPEMKALGFVPVNTGFEGIVAGNIAEGTGSYWRVPFWERDANTDCPRPAGLRVLSDREAELIVAVPLRETCQWTFRSIVGAESVQRVITKLEALFVVQEVRFFDQPEDGSPGERITNAAPDQKFRVEVEFDVPPPAAVYVDLGGGRLVAVRPTSNPRVFSSRAITRGELVPGARL
jgi:hypothetical protein